HPRSQQHVLTGRRRVVAAAFRGRVPFPTDHGRSPDSPIDLGASLLSQVSKNAAQGHAAPAVRPRGKARWSIALLMGFGILINYVDRLSISVTQKPLTQDFGLT